MARAPAPPLPRAAPRGFCRTPAAAARHHDETLARRRPEGREHNAFRGERGGAVPMAVKKHGFGLVFAASTILVMLSGSAAHAGIKKPVVPHFSLGASLPQGGTGDFLDDGWALHGGATWFSPD